MSQSRRRIERFLASPSPFSPKPPEDSGSNTARLIPFQPDSREFLEQEFLSKEAALKMKLQRASKLKLKLSAGTVHSLEPWELTKIERVERLGLELPLEKILTLKFTDITQLEAAIPLNLNLSVDEIIALDFCYIQKLHEAAFYASESSAQSSKTESAAKASTTSCDSCDESEIFNEIDLSSFRRRSETGGAAAAAASTSSVATLSGAGIFSSSALKHTYAEKPALPRKSNLKKY